MMNYSPPLGGCCTTQSTQFPSIGGELSKAYRLSSFPHYDKGCLNASTENTISRKFSPMNTDFLHNKNTAAIRILAADAIEKAKSGHPGAPMGMAEIAEVLWRHHLQHNPQDPNWLNRDRFVLSNGHGSMLIYALLHLTGYDLPMQEIQNFRQLHSKTPGHPEYKITPGVETTTGPLGQGIANAVGMALAEKLLADEFNQAEMDIIDHFTYVFLGDGCLMEGISHEACSLAGTLKLGKLIAFYDDNGISIDGQVVHWFADDSKQRFAAYGWQVLSIDGHDAAAIHQAILEAKSNSHQPTLICAKTTIGMGSPNKAGSHGVHGAALGEEEIAAVRKLLDWQHPPFEIPQEVYAAWDARLQGAKLQAEWQGLFESYAQQYPEQAKELIRRHKGDLGENWHAKAKELASKIIQEQKKVATRKASQIAIEALASITPEFLGGSADLTGSNLTNWKDCGAVRADSQGGSHINYGVREFGMAAMLNGIALHGGFIPFGGTFLTFSDYSRNAIRMAALMGIRVIHVFTHDSIGLGEDGPTHQAIEHLPALRLIPNCDVWRPADSLETMAAWISAVETSTKPSLLVLSRQGVAPIDNSEKRLEQALRGGYALAELANPQVQLVATGSEVEIAVASAKLLAEQGIVAKVVSMPCLEMFLEQDARYQKTTLDTSIPSVVVEAAIGDAWYRIVGAKASLVCMTGYGESAPAEDLYQHFGFTAENVARRALELIDFRKSMN